MAPLIDRSTQRGRQAIAEAEQQRRTPATEASH
jgi:hypothetical protein